MELKGRLRGSKEPTFVRGEQGERNGKNGKRQKPLGRRATVHGLKQGKGTGKGDGNGRTKKRFRGQNGSQKIRSKKRKRGGSVPEKKDPVREGVGWLGTSC